MPDAHGKNEWNQLNLLSDIQKRALKFLSVWRSKMTVINICIAAFLLKKSIHVRFS